MIVRVPPAVYVRRGVLLITTTSIPLALAFAVYVFSNERLHGRDRVPLAILVGLTLLGVLAGVWNVVRARQWSHETEVIFDRAHGSLRRATAEAGLDLRTAAAVRLRDRNLRIQRFWAIDVVYADGTTAMVVYDRLPPDYGAAMKRVVEAMDAWLREGTSVPAELGERRTPR